MNPKIIISPSSNLLFFIQKKYEKGLIKLNFQNYFNDKNIDLLFYKETEKKLKIQIGKSIKKSKRDTFEKKLAAIKPFFKLYWEKESKNLNSWKKYFRKNHSILQNIVLDIKKLTGVKNFKISETPIYLISDPVEKSKEINAWFSWTPKKNFMVIEIPYGLKNPNILFPIGILAHEYFHLILRKNKKFILEKNRIVRKNNKLLTKLAKRMPANMFFEELLVSSFIPEGYLGKKHLKIKIGTLTQKPRKLLEWRRWVAYKTKNRVKKYADNNKKIDREYLSDLIKIIK